VAFDSDVWVDRRRLKRSLTTWRLIAVAAVTVAVLAVVARFTAVLPQRYVARLDVTGLIVHDAERDQALLEVAEDDRVKALIVRIDSPGGTVVGGETLYRRLREVGERKPVVAVMGELATSAAYMTALAGDRIVAREGTLTGSIGVILQTADVTGLLDKLGIRPQTVKSGPLKAQPNPLEPFSPEAREAAREVVLDMYEMFVDMVVDRRRLGRQAVVALADGRVFTGRQALGSGLIDAVGGEEEAKAWLEQEHGVAREMPVRDLEIASPERVLRRLVDELAGKTMLYEPLKLDGLVSVWHP
jgi:protease-4